MYQGGVVWPLYIAPDLSSSPWFQSLTERAKEVSGRVVGSLSHGSHVAHVRLVIAETLDFEVPCRLWDLRTMIAAKRTSTTSILRMCITLPTDIALERLPFQLCCHGRSCGASAAAACVWEEKPWLSKAILATMISLKNWRWPRLTCRTWQAIRFLTLWWRTRGDETGSYHTNKLCHVMLFSYYVNIYHWSLYDIIISYYITILSMTMWWLNDMIWYNLIYVIVISDNTKLYWLLLLLPKIILYRYLFTHIYNIWYVNSIYYHYYYNDTYITKNMIFMFTVTYVTPYEISFVRPV